MTKHELELIVAAMGGTHVGRRRRRKSGRKSLKRKTRLHHGRGIWAKIGPRDKKGRLRKAGYSSPTNGRHHNPGRPRKHAVSHTRHHGRGWYAKHGPRDARGRLIRAR
jgi:hypothetical protein